MPFNFNKKAKSNQQAATMQPGSSDSTVAEGDLESGSFLTESQRNNNVDNNNNHGDNPYLDEYTA